MKNLLLLFITAFTFNFAFSQDKIFLKSEENIEAKILEINVDEVKYKKYSNLEGPTFTILKSDIHMIIYQNGESEIFKAEEMPSSTTPNTNVPTEKKILNEGGAKIGLFVGLPTADVKDFTNLYLGGEFSYLKEVATDFELGGLIGYSQYFIEKDLFPDDTQDIKFIPIAFSTRLYFGDRKFFAGLDLGYAIGIDEDNGGGFLYRPKFGFNLGKVNLIAAYQGVSVNVQSVKVNVESITAGIEFNLN
jgi:hypothetical protein